MDSSKKNINPPCLPSELFKDQSVKEKYISSNIPPFFSTTERIVAEIGNSDPNFLRSTMYTVPSSEFTLENCNIPFGLTLTPFSDKGFYTTSSGIDSCSFCRSYLNYFTKLDKDFYICNICENKSLLNSHPIKCIETLSLSSFEVEQIQTNDRLPSFSDAVADNQRILLYPQIANLSSPSFFFVFDNDSFGLVSNVLETILTITEDPNFRLLFNHVGFFILNDGITSFTTSGDKLRQIKLPSDATPFISSSVLIKTSDSTSIKQILKVVEKTNLSHKCSLRPFFNILKHISHFSIASKIALFSSKNLDVNYESILENVQNVNINLFKLKTDENISTMEKLAFFTAGEIFKYSSSDLLSLTHDLKSICLTRPYYDVDIVLKASDNLVKRSVVGATLKDNVTFVHLNHMASDSAVLFNLFLSGISRNHKYVQFQISFTDFDGSRKTRVVNHSFFYGTPTQVYSSLSFDSIFSTIIKRFLYEKVDMGNILVNMLVYYRSKCSSNTSSSQFVLPESLKCLPVLIQTFDKLSLVNKLKLISMNVENILRYFYPRLISLTEYASKQNLNETMSIRLSFSQINDQDIYILENSQIIFIYVSRNVDSSLIEKLFDLDDKHVSLKGSEDEENIVLKKLIDEINLHYYRELFVKICLAGKTHNEAEFLQFMIEDAINNQPNYIESIFQLHFKVQKG